MKALGRLSAWLSLALFPCSLAVVAPGLAGAQPAARPPAAAPAKPPATAPGPGKPTAADATCAGCHKDIAREKHVHGPVAVGVCSACHTRKAGVTHPTKPKHSESDFDAPAAGKDLCYLCHERKDTLPVVHGPIQWGLCSFCHDPHQSPNPFRLKERPVSRLCFKCHKNDKTIHKEVHGPVALGECTSCHDPHQGRDKVRLVAQGNDLCLGCHNERKQEFATRRFSHKPARENCNVCHDPHTSDNPARTRKPVPELCFSCHEAQGKHIAAARTQHDAYKIGKKCLNCHDPHTADQPKQLRAVTAQLCLGCHDKELDTPTGKIMNMKAWLADNPVIHGPIRQGDCAACHNPHGTDNFRILRRHYPAQFYAPFAREQYALCFGCHEPTLALEPQTTRLTNFRNGEKNLHFVHVNRVDKGRTCRACHETHASKRPKQIRESVPFGRWEIPTNYEKTETGGRCAPGCHVPRGYDRATAIVNK